MHDSEYPGFPKLPASEYPNVCISEGHISASCISEPLQIVCKEVRLRDHTSRDVSGRFNRLILAMVPKGCADTVGNQEADTPCCSMGSVVE
eukprot:7041925-Alexandrium_andersonii.AAC.1